MDPLAEKYPNWSPYNYVMNNPINAVDPDGRLVAPPGDDYGYNGTYLRSYNKLDGKVYIYKDASQKELVTTNLTTLITLTALAQGETTKDASWEQRTGVAEVPRNRAEKNGTSIYDEATKANQFNGLTVTRGTETLKALESYGGGSDIGSLLNTDQKRSAKCAIAALRGSNAANGADGFDGYKDLVGDFKAVERGKDPDDGGNLRARRGYDRPLKGMDTSLINGASIGLPSTTSLLPGPTQTYQATKVVWDKGKEGISGTVFYKIHPDSGLK